MSCARRLLLTTSITIVLVLVLVNPFSQARNATTTIPIVMVSVGDPVKVGLKKTAAALNIKIPQAVLVQADQVIE